MKFKRFFLFLSILMAIFFSAHLWSFIKLPYSNYGEIIGQYSLNNHHKLNDVLRVTVFIAIPIAIYLFFSSYFNLNKIKFSELISQFRIKKNNNKSILNNENLNLIFLISILFLFFNFITINFPSNKLDSLHEGQLLTSAYQNLETNTIWVKQYLQNSLFYDVIISKISFFLYGEQSISSLRLNIIFLNLLTDIFLLLFSFLFIKLLNLTHKKEVFFFTLIFAAILILNRSLHEWFWPVRFRDIPLILSLIFLLLYFINEKKNYLKLFFLGTLSAGSLLWSIDKGLYLNIIFCLFIFYLFLNKKIQNISIFILGILFSWVIFYFLVGSVEFNSFLSNTISSIEQRDYRLGIIYPEPFFEDSKHTSRATRNLLIIILNAILILNIFRDSVTRKEIKVFLFFIFALSCLNYIGGISRSDSYHLKQGIFFHNLTLSLIVMYYLEKIKFNFEILNKNIYLFSSLIIVFFVSISDLKLINNPLAFTDRYNKFLKLNDNFFLDKNYISFIDYLEKKAKSEECIQVLSYDISLNYLLKKKSCSNFTNPHSIGSKKSQLQLINQLKANNANLVITEGLLGYMDPVNNLNQRLPYIAKYLQDNLSKELKFLDWKIIFLRKYE